MQLSGSQFFKITFPESHFINPFAPTCKLPVTACVDPRSSTTCDIISFIGQGQLCLLTCAECRDLSNHTRMSTIQSRTPEKKAKNHVTLTWKFPWKSCSITHLPFLLSNSEIIRALLKTFPTKMKPTKCSAKKKKMRQEKQKQRGREKAKIKSQDCCVTLKPKIKLSRNVGFCACLTFAKLVFSIWIRRLRSVQPVIGFMVSFNSL